MGLKRTTKRLLGAAKKRKSHLFGAEPIIRKQRAKELRSMPKPRRRKLMEAIARFKIKK